MEIHWGIDENGNGLLDVDEIDGTDVICHGAYASFPSVASVTPAHGDTGVTLGGTLTVTFNRSMNPGSLTSATIVTLDNGTGIRVPGSIAYDTATYTATFTPAYNLQGSTTYKGLITTGVLDANGNAMPAEFSWTFTTAVDTSPPTVQSTVPADSAVGVGTGKAIAATFSERMNSASLTGNFTLVDSLAAPVAGQVSYGNNVASFLPDAPLAENETYTATITTAVTDLGGTALPATKTWSFSTGSRSWQGGQRIEAVSGSNVNSSQVAIDAFGNAIAVWRQGNAAPYNTYANRYSVLGGWEGAQALESGVGSAGDPFVKMSPNGHAVASWLQWNDAGDDLQLLARAYAANTNTWSGTTLQLDDPAVLSTQYMSDPSISVNENGLFDIGFHTREWVYAKYFVSWRRYDASSQVWTGKIDLHKVNSTDYYSPAFATDGNGNLISIRNKNGTTEGGRRNAGTGTWDFNTAFPSPAAPHAQAQVVANTAGDVIAAFTNAAHTALSAVTSEGTTSSWDGGSVPSLNSLATPQAGSPSVAITTNGDGFVTWHASDGSGLHVFARRFVNATNTWDAASTAIDTAAGDATDPQIAMDAQGNAVVVWVQVDNSGFRSVHAAHYTQGTGSWSNPILLENNDGDADQPRIAMTRNGNAVIVWRQQTPGGDVDLWANRFE